MLQLTKLTKSFTGMKQPALQEIDLIILPGEFCVVIGANGSGKSTLMKLISGEYQPDSGGLRVFHDGSHAPHIAAVTQDIQKGTVGELTLLENVALSLMRKNKIRFSFYSRYKKVVLEKLRSLNMGLEAYLHQPLSALSGGQRQMVATIMAIESGASLLLLDEHTSALDPKMQSHLMTFTAKAIAKSKLTTLMITHKLEDAVQYGSRLIMLQEGRIVLDVSGRAKAQLTTQQILRQFYRNEFRPTSMEAS